MTTHKGIKYDDRTVKGTYCYIDITSQTINQITSLQ